MPKCSRVFEQHRIEIETILGSVRAPSLSRLQELLAKSLGGPLPLPELAELLEIGCAPASGEQFEALRCFVLSRFRKPGGNRLRYIAPIYISSHCIDSCAYCNFSAARSVPRKRLGLEDFEAELAAVAASGPRVIELVLATDPDFSPAVLARYVARTSEFLNNEPGSGVLLCSDYLPVEVYAALRKEGLWGMVQWDETLDIQAYNRWHATSPRKRDFVARKRNHERAMSAGLEVATGALFGLADFRYDVLMQVAKARFLENEYGRKPFCFGTARITPIGGRELHPSMAVPDRAYEVALMVYKIAEPAIARWLQTRETFDMNVRNMLDGDVFTYRCGEVRPGGHRNSLITHAASGQFGVNDMPRETAEEKLAASGFYIDYAWLPN